MRLKLEKSLAWLILIVYIYYCTPNCTLMVQNCKFLRLKSVFINKGKSRLFAKIVCYKKLTNDTNKASPADIIKKGLMRCVKTRYVRGC